MVAVVLYGRNNNMSNNMGQIAIIVNKTCDICKFVEATDTLFCLKYDNRVEDNFVCNEFELCKEVMSDTFFKIEEIREHEKEI